MINPKEFFEFLQKSGVNFFTGVPDSLFKDFCAYVVDNTNPKNHLISSNEGGAIAIASGYHLATGKTALVYMQNSGLGNAVNPLTSLSDKEVYGIPMVLLIGWRGEPGKKDEPQHKKQGEITPELLRTLEIPFSTLSNSVKDFEKVIKKAVNHAKKVSSPFAILVKEGTFASYVPKKEKQNFYEISREEAIEEILKHIGKNDIVVSTTGKASRELFELRERNRQGHQNDFLTVGSMGHSSLIALGVALQKPRKNVLCFDGDGALIMHMGHLAIIGKSAPKNFFHIVLNNEAHESVGGQPTAADKMNFIQIAKACSYTKVFLVKNKKELAKILPKFLLAEGPSFLEIKCSLYSRKNLGRPTRSPKENKKDFMSFIKR